MMIINLWNAVLYLLKMTVVINFLDMLVHYDHSFFTSLWNTLYLLGCGHFKRNRSLRAVCCSTHKRLPSVFALTFFLGYVDRSMDLAWDIRMSRTSNHTQNQCRGGISSGESRCSKPVLGFHAWLEIWRSKRNDVKPSAGNFSDFVYYVKVRQK